MTALVQRHPVNLLRVADFWRKGENDAEFRGLIGHVKLIQRKAVTAEPLCRRRALR